MDRYEGEIYEVPEFIPGDDEDEHDYDPEDEDFIYDVRTHSYVHAVADPTEPFAVWELELMGAFENIPRAPWERPEDSAPEPDLPVYVFAFPPSETPEFVYRVDVRFSNGVSAVISFPSVEARDAFLAGEDIENYRIEGEDL